MGVLQVYPFDDEINYIRNNIDIVAGKAKLGLIPHPNQVFTQDFSSDVGFIYDNSKSEFVGGMVRQKDLRPIDSVLAATYTSSKNLNWSATGVLSGTDVGLPVLNAGKLECLGGGNNAVLYENPDIGASGNIGAIKIKYTPNYSGTPVANYNIFEFSPLSGNNDRMLLFHSSSGGTLRLTAYTSAGTIKHSAVAFGAAWSPVAGTEYELELNWDSVAGQVRLFVNGVLQGSMPVSSYARGSDADRLYVGAGTVYAAADAAFNDVLLFSTVQHTAGYTPGYTPPEFIYSGSTVQLPDFSYTGVGTILSVESSDIVEAGGPRYIVAGLYWNGTAWVTSNGTYVQANTSAEAIANLPSLVVTGALTVSVKVVFNDQNIQASVDLISIAVTGQRYSPSGTIEVAQALQVQEISSYSQTDTQDVDTDVLVQIRIDGILKYHNGIAWVNSDGTAGQSNTAQQISDNLATLNLGKNSSVAFRWLLTTAIANKTPDLDESVISYDFGGLETVPTKCLVWGYLRDISGESISGAEIQFEIKRAQSSEYKEASNNILVKNVSILSDANGYFEKELIRSSEFQGSGIYLLSIKVDGKSFNKLGTGSKVEFSVPDADNKNISDLIIAS